MPGMRIRLKLLILLLVIALVPLVSVIWYDLRATRQLGLDLSDRAREVLEGKAMRQLHVDAIDSSQLLERERKLLETAVRLQAKAVQEALARPPPDTQAPVVDPRLPFSGTGKVEGIAVDAGAIAAAMPPTMDPAAADRTMRRLGGLAPILAQLRREYAPNALWQRVVLASGVRAVYPAHARLRPVAGDGPAWYERVRATRGLVVLPPRTDPWTGLPVLTVAAPILSPEGDVVGATAIDAPLPAVLADVAAEAVKPARVLIVQPEEGGALRVLAERRDGSIVARDVVHEAAQWPGLAAVLRDMKAGRDGVRRVAFRGEDTLWGYAPIEAGGAFLLFLVPHHEVIAEALEAQAYVFDQLADRRAVLWMVLLVFLPLLVGLAFFASRAVTQPVSQLADAARRLAAGDFQARTRIRSGDELEELGKLFNVMVPQLHASMRMRDSLVLAQEVQQNLLPRDVPVIPGFDIAGRSLYCDETGGDYFDFMALPQLGPGGLAVMIGDVAGHGISAALLMTTARALLRSQAPLPGRLAGLVGAVNGQLCRDSHAGRFMTLFVAALDSGAQTINWVGAGHEPGFIFDPELDRFQEIAGPDIPLGVDGQWQYQEFAHAGWSRGTVMLLGTDGIWETRNPDGRMFGKDALRAVIRANAARPAEAIADAVTEALAHFREGRPQADDVTLVVVKAT